MTWFTSNLGTPDPNLIRKPIWTTWARYFREINETFLLEFADEIISNGFPVEQIELDDSWTTHYGDFEVSFFLKSLFKAIKNGDSLFSQRKTPKKF